MKYQVPSDYPIRIKRLRGKHGLTQTNLADLLGVSFVTVNRWENGKAKPTVLAWQRILHAEAMGIEALSVNLAQEGLVAKEDNPAYGTDMPAPVDFSADPEIVRLVAEGERLGLGHLCNPLFATEISLIHPLPHQRVAVYDYLLKDPCLRFMLADDAGAGKTIMSGLYIREMLARRLIKRALVVPPAGLLGNWERELRTLFDLRFHIVRGSEARANNPFVGPESDLVIISLDTLAGEKMYARLQEDSVIAYDLVIFDEAHKLSADLEPDLRIRKTERYRLAESLSGTDDNPRWHLNWSAKHLLLLTATPHMGKDFPYYSLWRLLLPEIFPTWESFQAYSGYLHHRHFLRRTKEQMVNADGTPIYPMRISDTLSYELTQGDESEQALYDQTTDYLREFYNRAKILNRSAVRFAMTIFQRRLASSTYALLESLKSRLHKLEDWIAAIRNGKITSTELMALQLKLDHYPDVWDDKTAEEEEAQDGQEENELVEQKLLDGIVATSLAELEVEKVQVAEVLALAERVYQKGEESKFSKLQEILQDPRYKDEKIIIFTEHRDTLHFLVRRLEGLGFTGKIAQIHGGMAYDEREDQVKFFRKTAADGGATYLIGTDAAGEGINLQFCWLIINYDIPWNPARLEQRMGRIHRYGQKHNPVVILNLVAKNTREGRVLTTLLKKLETIRKELGSDKVFDCIGRLLENISLKAYMEKILTEDGTKGLEKKLEEILTAERVKEICDKEKSTDCTDYADYGENKEKNLCNLRNLRIDSEEYYHLLPGNIYYFLEKAATLLGLGIEGTMDNFCFTAFPPKLDFLLYALDAYLPSQQDHFTVLKPHDPSSAIFLRPGDLFFDKFRSFVCSYFQQDALRGSVFIAPNTEESYLFHLALFTIEREADPDLALPRSELLEYRLVGIRQAKDGTLEACPVESLLLLKGSQGVPASEIAWVKLVQGSLERVSSYILQQVAAPIADERRQSLLVTLEERQDFLKRGYDFQAAQFAMTRAKVLEKERSGDREAKAELQRIKERQKLLGQQLAKSQKRLAREPQLIAPKQVTFLAHALVIPAQSLEDRQAYSDDVEKIAMQVAIAYEKSKDAQVLDVSTPEQARAAGLIHWPGFDLLSKRSDGEERAIEVKGRAYVGNIELSTNEWVKACNLRSRYWLYVVFDCATPHLRLLRICDPFGKLLGQPRGGVVIEVAELLKNAEGE